MEITASQQYDYLFPGVKRTWKGARKYCRRLYADLASIHSKEEHLLVEDQKGQIWLGGHAQRQWNSFIWTWSDATFFGDYKLVNIEINEHCMSLHNGEKAFQSADCNERHYFVCKKYISGKKI